VSFENLLNVAAEIKRPLADYDDMGSVTYTLVTFATKQPVRISQGVPAEVSSGPAEWSEATVMIYTLPGTDYKRDDEVHANSAVYEVLGVKTPSVPDHHTSLVCKVQTFGS
jgi:hypothetical protein